MLCISFLGEGTLVDIIRETVTKGFAQFSKLSIGGLTHLPPSLPFLEVMESVNFLKVPKRFCNFLHFPKHLNNPCRITFEEKLSQNLWILYSTPPPPSDFLNLPTVLLCIAKPSNFLQKENSGPTMYYVVMVKNIVKR